MLCQNCGENEANVKYTQIINGVKKEMALCEKCSKTLGVDKIDFNIPISFSSFLGDFLSEYDNSNFIPMIATPKELRCNTCNMSYDEFMNTGKFGCSNCYDAFSDRIDSVLKRLHGENTHTGRKGKVNKKVEIAQQENKLSKKDSLKQELQKAIEQENYEQAAKIRDEIKKLEKKGE